MSELNSKILKTEIKSTKNKKIISKQNTKYSNDYFMENQALRNGFGKMIKSNYKTSPKYSFSHERKFHSNLRTFITPGPDKYSPSEGFFVSCCIQSPKYSFPRNPRFYKPWNFKKDAFYDIPYSVYHKNNAPKFSKEKRFKDDFTENLFLPIDYS